MDDRQQIEQLYSEMYRAMVEKDLRRSTASTLTSSYLST